jgi:DnaJ domain
MVEDPAGFYARLGVAPTAPTEAIIAAYRAKARVLHPDIPGTGDAAAFMRMKEAYDVLADAERRASYDRSAHAAGPVMYAMPEVDNPAWPTPRFWDLTMVLWVVLAGGLILASVMVVLELARSPTTPPPSVARTFVPAVPTTRPAATAVVPVPIGGAASHYVLPGGDNAVVWRRDAISDSFHPGGRIADFTAVQALSVVPQHGLVEVRLADGGSGFIDASRLTPGDRRMAQQAYCAFNAGAPPRNGEVLARRGQGSARLAISNRSGQPAVVKLRDASGRSIASVFLEPGGASEVGLPNGVYRPDFALGEIWSRACDSFTSGMRAQRFAGYGSVSGLSPLVIPPEISLAPAPVDIPDQAFEQD